MDKYADLEQFKANPSDFITPARQKEMDKEAMMYLQAERSKPGQTPEYYASLDREIAKLPAGTPVVKPMTDDFSDLEQFKAPVGNAGRGSVNPPLVGEVQPQQLRTGQRRGTMPKSGYYSNTGNVAPTFSDVGQAAGQAGTNLAAIAEPVGAAAIGGATGATAGTFAYVPTAFQYAAQRLMGKHPEFSKLLGENREAIKTLREQNPVAYGTGDVGGSVALGAATGGGSIPAAMAKQGLIGAVRTASDSDKFDIDEAVKSGLVNAAVTGAAGGVGVLVNKAGKIAKIAEIKRYAEEAGLPFREAVRDFANNAKQFGQGGVPASEVLKGEAKTVLKNTLRAAAPVVGTGVGAYVGGKTAESLGMDKSTGQTLGGMLGGGTGFSTWKKGMAADTAEAAKRTLGYASSTNKNFGSDAATSLASKAIPATQALISNVKPAPDDYSDLEAYKVTE